MLYYKNNENEVFSYDDNIDQNMLNGFISDLQLIKITKEEAELLLAPDFSVCLQCALDAKVAAVDDKAYQHIATEFQSDALGTVHSYDCRKIDQLNLQHAIYESQTTSSSVEYLAKPSGQSYQEKPHTESQLRQVHLAMTSHIRQHRDVARSKKANAYLGFENQDIDAINAVDENDWS